MTAYYNEFDPYAAQWLRNLVDNGLVAPGHVDERSIKDVTAGDLKGYTQCHFFAGIGVWSMALRAAGWPDDRPVWTGSCPCQPFSAAGQRKAFDDDRHLWPIWFDLIAQCAPPVVLGEQVASKGGLQWLDLVSADVESAGYALGASDLCAAGFGQAHIRQRIYFVALGDLERLGQQPRGRAHREHDRTQSGASGSARGVADEPSSGRERSGGSSEAQEQRAAERGTVGGMADNQSAERELSGSTRARRTGLADNGGADRMADGEEPRRFDRDDIEEGRHRADIEQPASSRALSEMADNAGGDTPAEREQRRGEHRQLASDESGSRRAVYGEGEIDVAARWFALDWLLCRNPAGEPSWRPVEPGTFPLAHGLAMRPAKLRAYGNSLDYETAAGFCAAVIDAIPDTLDLEGALA